MDPVRPRNLRHDLRLDAGTGLTPAPGIRSRSAPISAAATSSIEHWPCSPRAYADQNERDYQALQQGVSSGQIKAETGV